MEHLSTRSSSYDARLQRHVRHLTGSRKFGSVGVSGFENVALLGTPDSCSLSAHPSSLPCSPSTCRASRYGMSSDPFVDALCVGLSDVALIDSSEAFDEAFDITEMVGQGRFSVVYGVKAKAKAEDVQLSEKLTNARLRVKMYREGCAVKVAPKGAWGSSVSGHLKPALSVISCRCVRATPCCSRPSTLCLPTRGVPTRTLTLASRRSARASSGCATSAACSRSCSTRT